jgi:hypothetical protein
MKSGFQPNWRLPDIAVIAFNSYNCALHRGMGEIVSHDTSYAIGGAGDFFADIFRVTGLVEVLALYGEFSAPAGVNGPAHCYWSFNDGIADVPLTSGTPGVGGVDCSSAIVGSTILKNASAANPAVYLAGNQCRIAEMGTTTRPFYDILLQAKPTVNTNHIRFNYSMDGAGDFSITWVAIWACRFPGSRLESM